MVGELQLAAWLAWGWHHSQNAHYTLTQPALGLWCLACLVPI